MTILTHNARTSRITKESVFGLGDSGLTHNMDDGNIFIAFAEIEHVQLISYVATGGIQGRVTIFGESFNKLIIPSHHYVSAGLFNDRSETYNPFVRRLCTRLAAANGQAQFSSGSGFYWALWLVILVVSLIISSILMFTLIGGQTPQTASLTGLAIMLLSIVFSWRSMQRMRKKSFDPQHPPI